MRTRRSFLRLTGGAAGAAFATARYGIDEVAALTEQAAAGGRTPAQVVLRWHQQSHTVPLPKSSDTRRMAENLDIFDWELDEDQMHRMRMLHTGISGSGYDPNTHEEM